MWLAPVQAVTATVVSDADDWAMEVLALLRKAGVRAEADIRNEKISYKVREHSLQKIPVILVLGRREAEERTVTVRRFGSREQTTVAAEEFIRQLRTESLPPDLRE